MAKAKNKSNKKILDKHKTWLIAGITVAVIAVLVLFLYSPARVALFGKAVGTGTVCTTTNDCPDPAGSGCVSGYCKELICNDGIDNDGDDTTSLAPLPGSTGPQLPPQEIATTTTTTTTQDIPPQDSYVPTGWQTAILFQAGTDCTDSDCNQKDCSKAGAPESAKCANFVCTELACADGEDNDQDGAVDCADSDCAGKVGCLPSPEQPIPSDSDGDGFPDTADNCPDLATNCGTTANCPPGFFCSTECACMPQYNSETLNCNDGEDNDQDGATDCIDDDCAGQKIEVEIQDLETKLPATAEVYCCRVAADCETLAADATCEGNACIFCTEGDNGRDFYTAGTSHGISFPSQTDFCAGNILTEYFCNKEKIVESVTFDCLSEGRVCEGGACSGEAACPSADWSNVCCVLDAGPFMDFITAFNEDPNFLYSPPEFMDFITAFNAQQSLCVG